MTAAQFVEAAVTIDKGVSYKGKKVEGAYVVEGLLNKVKTIVASAKAKTIRFGSAVKEAVAAGTKKAIAFVKAHSGNTALAFACTAVAAPFVSGIVAAMAIGAVAYAGIKTLLQVVSKKNEEKVTASSVLKHVVMGAVYAGAGTGLFWHVVPFVNYWTYVVVNYATAYVYVYGSYIAYFLVA